MTDDMPRLGLVLPLAAGYGDARTFVDELVVEVRAADDAGFDLCLVPEHHRAPQASIVAPLTLCAALATVTKRIRVGPGILILPSHHPLHVAEQVTMIDQLSGGRVVLGVGAGYQAEDLEPFGVSVKERGGRFESALTELGALLGPGSSMNPAPVQAPRPPIWVGSWAPVGIRRAARLADGWIADPIRTIAEVAGMADAYREACDDPPGEVIVMREAWIDGEPGNDGRFAAAITPIFDYYRRNGAADIPATFEAFARDRFVWGSAEACASQVREIGERTGADVVALTVRHPRAPDHETVLEGIRALGAVWAEKSAA